MAVFVGAGEPFGQEGFEERLTALYIRLVHVPVPAQHTVHRRLHSLRSQK